MAAFRTNFWELLTEKEQDENKRYTNLTALANDIGTTRPTLYKYADEQMTSVDAETVTKFLEFFSLGFEDVGKFLVLDNSPQLNGQELRANGVAAIVEAIG